MSTTKVPASRMVDHNIGSYCFRNKIINGDMSIDQRSAGSAVTIPGASNLFATSDRWAFDNYPVATTPARITSQVVTDAPPGFSKSLRLTVTTPASIDASQSQTLYQYTENLNVFDLCYGTSSAKTTTVSFWVKASVAGKYSCTLTVLLTVGASSAASYISNYTINTANTWEYKTITIPGYSVAGLIQGSSTRGIGVCFVLGSGSNWQNQPNMWSTGTGNNPGGGLGLATSDSVNLGLISGSTFQITGVQFEVGPTATPFEYRPIGTELALCQRYFQSYTTPALRGVMGTTTSANRLGMQLPVVMRTTPTLIATGNLNVYDGSYVGKITPGNIGNKYLFPHAVEFDATVTSQTGTFTIGRPLIVFQGPDVLLPAGTVNIDAEL